MDAVAELPLDAMPDAATAIARLSRRDSSGCG